MISYSRVYVVSVPCRLRVPKVQGLDPAQWRFPEARRPGSEQGVRFLVAGGKASLVLSEPLLI